MRCSEYASAIRAHIERYGDGEIVMSGDRRAPVMHNEGADCLVVEEAPCDEPHCDMMGGCCGHEACECDCESCLDCENKND